MIINVVYMIAMIICLTRWVGKEKSTLKRIQGVVLILALELLIGINVAFLTICRFFQIGIVVILIREHFNI